MGGEPADFWGKLRQDGETLVWHPLLDHCQDVAAVFLALLGEPTIRRRLAALGGQEDLHPTHVDRLGWLALLHDVGKLNLGFQRRLGVGHIAPVGALFHAKLRARTLSALRWSEMQQWVAAPSTLDDLFLASISHHGVPASLDRGDARHLHLWQPAGGLDPLAGLERLTTRGERHFSQAFTAGGPKLPDLPAFQHGFAGLVSLADWIGSDVTFFPYSDAAGGDRMPFARRRASEAIAAIGMAPSAARKALGSAEPYAAIGLGFAPNDIQEAISALPSGQGPTVALLEAPTGSGKTEAALARFLRLFAAGEVDGLYFALPTRAAAVQIHARVHRAVVHAFADAAPPVLLAVPGYIRVDDAEGRLLPDFEVLWPDRDAAVMVGRGWAAENPKRYLAGAIVVGTIDQALMSALRVRHAHLRGAALIRHLLVVDEVHASDPYMSGILCQLLDLFREARGHALLMSATLGSAAQALLLGDAAVRSAEAAKLLPYPAVILATRGRTSLMASPNAPAARRVMMEAVPAMHDAGRCAAMALEAARAGGRVLVIRNTVRAAIDTQQCMEASAEDGGRLLFHCSDVPAPHHSRFSRDDRKLLDAAVEAAFDRSSTAPVVLAATQTVEQSLDIDADLLITDLCPADVLLQRIGRLHRHCRPRAAAFATARCLVLVPADRDLSNYITRGRDGLGLRREQPLAYPDIRGIEVTWRLVEQLSEWDLPVMNRMLVEETTHSSCLEAIADERGGAWLAHQSILHGVIHGQRSVARMNRLDRGVPFGEVEPFGGLDGRITTRLGADDRWAEFAEPQRGPFGKPILRLPVPGWMARGIPADAVPEIAGSSPLRFRWAERNFLYDRLGLRATE